VAWPHPLSKRPLTVGTPGSSDAYRAHVEKEEKADASCYSMKGSRTGSSPYPLHMVKIQADERENSVLRRH
jgi:hypothetical protein